MKRIKRLCKIITLFIIVSLLIFSTGKISFAAKDNNEYYVMLYSKSSEKRPTGFYWVRTTGVDKPVIKLVKTNKGGTTNSDSTVIYCLDNERGFGTGNGSSAVDYRMYFDMRNPSSVTPSNYKLTPPFNTNNGYNYNSLMWLLDNIAVDTDSKSALSQKLKSATGFEISDLQEYSMPISDKNLQESDVLEVVQQAAIWRVLKSDGQFRPGNPTDFAWTQNRNDGTPNHILDVNYYDDMVEGGAAKALYNYLINNATSNSSYDYTKNGTSPITYVKGFTDTTKPTAVIDGTNYKVGPYNLTNRTGSNLVDIDISIPSGATLVNASGTELSGNTNKEKILSNFGKDFYVKMPISGSATTMTITITPKYSTRQVQYRTTESSPSSNQPIVVIENKNLQETKTSSVSLTPPTIDLALRKFITGVTDSTGNSKTISNISGRTPTVDATSLEPTGTTNTTGVYKHRKDPVKVETGDIVKYTIRVYNEGSAKGLATQIIDQLPAGLAYKSIETSNYEATIPTGVGNGEGNQVILTRKNKNNPLDEFTKGGTPKYEDIKITCEVTAEANNTNQVLTNIAWISKEYNAVLNEEFTTEGKDRDSAPSVAPTYSNEWKGTTTETDLSKQIYYPGQQDDDDFEKLIMDPSEGTMDLALRKYIETIPRTDTDMYNGVVLVRTVEVDESPLKNGTGTTAIYKHAKNPISVNTGNKILYCLTIFNEGSVEGRATKITDQLPAGIVLDETVETPIISENFELESYNKNSNQIALKRKEGNNTNLPAYTPGSLDGTGTIDGTDTIGIVCEVQAEPDQNNDKVLTNIAWISEQINGKTGEVITNQENKDIDSVPATHPTYSNDWKGTTAETDLSKQIYYPGQQDDDDFEKVVLKPKAKQFDLALRKFISGVKDSNGNTKTIASREPQITDTEKQKLGTDEATFDSGTTSEKDHTKTPVEVNANDIVTFTIRIYNEGQVDGHATEITDYIPEGLEFVTGTENNNKWTYDQSTRKAKTTQLASTILKAFDTTTNKLDYQDIKIDCKVNGNGKNFKNIAAITNADKEDRDSKPQEQPNPSSYNPTNPTKGHGEQDDDDYDEVKLPDLYFDLALRKYITEINGSKVSPSREPSVDVASLKNKTSSLDSGKTAIKTHTKDPLSVSKGDKVKYTIKIYNEGNVNGTATKIVDYLPEGLKIAENSETNRKYGWVQDNSSKAVMTTYLSDKNISAFDGSKISSDYVEIECEVIGDGFTSKQLKNVAEITESKNDANITKDRDSTPNNVQEKGNNYNVSTSTRGRGYEDDDDYEELLITRFDLALRKFITGVNNEKITNREPVVDTSKMGTMGADGKEITSFTYNHTKEPVKVEQNNVVIYTLRVYNEGNVNGYAETIKDDIPEGLEFLPDHEINKQYGWNMQDESGKTTTDVTKAKYVATDYRSRAKSATENIIKAYNKATMQTPDFKDVQIAFKVTEPNTSDRIVINKAQISKHSDEKGNTNIKDIDSTPDVWNEGEDDQDIEKIYVKYFDLALRKWVTHAIVIEDGVQKEMETGHTAEDDPESVVKIEINKKRLEDTVVKFRYSIKIKNEGEIAGAATEISDYIPNGLKFNQADNPKWRESNGKVITDQLKDTILQPGEEATVDILLTWENSESNMGVMVNVAEISADYNESGTPDIDSTPNNRKEGEDDIDDAPVALTVVAGSAPTYIAIASGITLIIGGGIFFIKKYVI